MKRSDDERIASILDAAGKLPQFVCHGWEFFEKDLGDQLAVERLLEIIGEAARAMSPEARARYPDVPWSNIIGLRVRIAHLYDDLDYRLLYFVATRSVPELVAQLRGTPPGPEPME